MTSYMRRKGALALSLILQLAVICARASPMPTTGASGEEQEMTTIETLPSVEEQLQVQSTSASASASTLPSQLQPHRIDCKLAFDATMDSLEQQQLQQDNGCNVPYTSSTNKPADASHDQEREREEEREREQEVAKDHKPKPANVLRHSMSGSSSQPLYELQLVVWPSDAEDGDESGSTTPRTTTSTTTAATTTTTTTTPSMLPLYENQLVVFPQMDFEEENFDYIFDELPPELTPSSTVRPPFPSSTTTSRPKPTAGPDPPQRVYVLENYRIKHPNGTEEHKLVLSNGVVNYMKLYVKRVGEKSINVQEGYNSVPIAGQKPQIQTVYYIADERGYNVYRIDHSPLSTILPIRVLDKATKSSESMPST